VKNHAFLRFRIVHEFPGKPGYAIGWLPDPIFELKSVPKKGSENDPCPAQS